MVPCLSKLQRGRDLARMTGRSIDGYFENTEIREAMLQTMIDDGIDQKNLAIDALRCLLNDEKATRTNLAKKDAFSLRLTEAIARYHNRSVDALQIIQELQKLARDLREESEDGLS